MRSQVPMILNQMSRKTVAPFQGILGLSPEDESAGPLYVNSLYDQGQITEKKFSILSPPNSNFNPKLTFGGYQKDNVEEKYQKFYVSEINNITAHRIGGSFHWELPLMKFGMVKAWDINTTITFRPKVNNVLLDTGSSIILMYYEDHAKFLTLLCDYIDAAFNATRNTTKPIECLHQGYGFITIPNCDVDCLKRLPVINLTIDSYNYGIRPNQYLKVNQDGDPTVLIDEDEKSEDISFYCTLKVFPHMAEQWILGAPFLNDYY